MLKTTPKSQCINPVNLPLRQTTETGRGAVLLQPFSCISSSVLRDHLISTCHSRPLRNVRTEREEQCRVGFQGPGLGSPLPGFLWLLLISMPLIWFRQDGQHNWSLCTGLKGGTIPISGWEQTFLQRNLRVCFTLVIRKSLATSIDKLKTRKISDSMLSVVPEYLYKHLHLEFV